MRENRTHGSEGGEDGVLLYPYHELSPLPRWHRLLINRTDHARERCLASLSSPQSSPVMHKTTN